MLKTNIEVIQLILAGAIKYGCDIKDIVLGDLEDEFVIVTFSKDGKTVTRNFQKHRTEMYDQWFEKYIDLAKGVRYGLTNEGQFKISNTNFINNKGRY